jgi:hypothetical protein
MKSILGEINPNTKKINALLFLSKKRVFRKRMNKTNTIYPKIKIPPDFYCNNYKGAVLLE